jgi:hypothetical protein
MKQHGKHVAYPTGLKKELEALAELRVELGLTEPNGYGRHRA